ncbi:MFS transporter [Streptomyces sp. ISL-66]|uniref:MFS transporter n=1 Tax=Streptomyces sp. ISL-66 TaxID=2819186 RepID=UPI0027E550F2|nr:MFS transporter [Streptomyces sp. ISL-66]
MTSGTALKERRYRLLVGGYAISSYGTFLNLIALNLYVYAVTDRALAVGVFLIVRFAAGFLTGLVCGPLLARWSAKSAMLWANLVQAAAMVLLVAAPDGYRTAALFTVSAVVGAAGTLFMVAFRSSIPAMVGEGRTTWANSLMVSWRSLAMVAGFASSGLVVSLLGYTAAFLADMATFLICALAVALLPTGADRPGDADREDGEAGGGKGNANGKVRSSAALAALTTAPALLLMVALRGVDALGSSSHNAALPVYSTRLDTDDPAVFVSVFWCVWAVGNVLVQQVLRQYTKRTERSVGALGFGLGTIAMSATFILAFAGFPWAATIVVAVLAGAADGLTEVSYTSHLQTLPSGLRTHAFGLSATVENLGFGIGMIVVAAALDAFTPLSVVAVAHGAAIGVALVFVAQVLWQRGTSRKAAAASEKEGNGNAGPARGSHRDGAEVSGR